MLLPPLGAYRCPLNPYLIKKLIIYRHFINHSDKYYMSTRATTTRIPRIPRAPAQQAAPAIASTPQRSITTSRFQANSSNSSNSSNSHSSHSSNSYNRNSTTAKAPIALSTRVEEGEYQGHPTLSIWDNNRQGKAPIISFGFNKAQAIVANMAAIQAWVEEQETLRDGQVRTQTRAQQTSTIVDETNLTQEEYDLIQQELEKQ